MGRSVLALFASLAWLVPQGLPDSELKVKDLRNHPFASDFPSGSSLRLRLRLYLRSGGFRIVGRNDNRIAVHFQGRNVGYPRDLTVRFRRSGIDGDLRVSGSEFHGGLFRSFEKSGSGRHKLHAHVGAGDLTLR